MSNSRNWTAQKDCPYTPGSVDVATGATAENPGDATFAQAFGAGPIDVYWALEDANDPPRSMAGVGSLSGGSVDVSSPTATFDGTTYDDAPSAAITLTSPVTIRCTVNASEFDKRIYATDVTFENLNTNGDVGTGATQVAQGDHLHVGVYEPADATIIKQADVDDTPVNGATTVPISSNWAFDHLAAADPHPQYLFQAEADALYLGIGAQAADSLLLGGQSSAYHLNRANHTGTQAQSTVIDLTTDLAGKEPVLGTPAADGYVLSSTIAGVRSWIAQTGGAGGGLTNVAVTGNATAVVGNNYLSTPQTSAATYTMTLPDPAGASEGDIIGFQCLEDTTTEELIIAEFGGAEWSRLFIKRESVQFKLSNGAWSVWTDDRIPCIGVIQDLSATPGYYQSGVSVTPPFDTILENVGGIVDLPNFGITVRRNGKYEPIYECTTGQESIISFLQSQITINGVSQTLYRTNNPTNASVRISSRTGALATVLFGQLISAIAQCNTTGGDITWPASQTLSPKLMVKEIL